MWSAACQARISICTPPGDPRGESCARSTRRAPDAATETPGALGRLERSRRRAGLLIGPQDRGQVAVVDPGQRRIGARADARRRVPLVKRGVTGSQRLVLRQGFRLIVAMSDSRDGHDHPQLRVRCLGVGRDVGPGKHHVTRRDRHAGPDPGQRRDDRAGLDRGTVDHGVGADRNRLASGRNTSRSCSAR